MWRPTSNLMVGIVTFLIGAVSAAMLSTPTGVSESKDVRSQNSKVVIRTKECTPVAPHIEHNEMGPERLAMLNKMILETESRLADLMLDSKLLSEKAERDMRIRILQLEINLEALKLELKVELERAAKAPTEKALYRELCYEN